jgi:hypothetical protein
MADEPIKKQVQAANLDWLSLDSARTEDAPSANCASFHESWRCDTQATARPLGYSAAFAPYASGLCAGLFAFFWRGLEGDLPHSITRFVRLSALRFDSAIAPVR